MEAGCEILNVEYRQSMIELHLDTLVVSTERFNNAVDELVVCV
jgi:hypothetical protein